MAMRQTALKTTAMYFAHLFVVLLTSFTVQAAVLRACDFEDCDPSCGDCGYWAEFYTFYEDEDCISCGVGTCHHYTSMPEGGCDECDANYIKQCLTFRF